MLRGDAVCARRDPERQRRHPEAGLARLDAPEGEDLVGRDPAAACEAVEVAARERLVELLVPGRNGCVRGEDGRGADELERLGEREAELLDERPGPLEAEERGVSLVHVEDAGLEPEPAESPNSADAEQHLLADPVLAVAAVQHVGHLGLEQVEADAADVGAPDPGGGRLAGELDLDADRLEHEPEALGVEGRVPRLLPVVLECLLEVALPVEQADADERDAQVGRGLEVVAGEDAEPARVDRERLAQPELRREVGDEEARVAVRPLPPAHARPSPAAAPAGRSPAPPPPGAAGGTVLSGPVLSTLFPPAPHRQRRPRNAQAKWADTGRLMDVPSGR